MPVAERHARRRRELAAEIAAAEAELGDHGRVLVRPSGTEPLVRVMVEAATDGAGRRVADARRLAGLVRHAGPRRSRRVARVGSLTAMCGIVAILSRPSTPAGADRRRAARRARRRPRRAR